MFCYLCYFLQIAAIICTSVLQYIINVTTLKEGGKRGDEELLNKGDFNTKQNSGIAGDIETDMKTFRPDPEARKRRAVKGETKLEFHTNHTGLGTTKLIMTGKQEGPYMGTETPGST